MRAVGKTPECIQAKNLESFPAKDDNGLSFKASTTRSEVNRAAGDFDAFAQLAERFGLFFCSNENVGIFYMEI